MLLSIVSLAQRLYSGSSSCKVHAINHVLLQEAVLKRHRQHLDQQHPSQAAHPSSKAAAGAASRLQEQTQTRRHVQARAPLQAEEQSLSSLTSQSLPDDTSNQLQAEALLQRIGRPRKRIHLPVQNKQQQQQQQASESSKVTQGSCQKMPHDLQAAQAMPAAQAQQCFASDLLQSSDDREGGEMVDVHLPAAKIGAPAEGEVVAGVEDQLTQQQSMQQPQQQPVRWPAQHMQQAQHAQHPQHPQRMHQLCMRPPAQQQISHQQPHRQQELVTQQQLGSGQQQTALQQQSATQLHDDWQQTEKHHQQFVTQVDDDQQQTEQSQQQPVSQKQASAGDDEQMAEGEQAQAEHEQQPALAPLQLDCIQAAGCSESDQHQPATPALVSNSSGCVLPGTLLYFLTCWSINYLCCIPICKSRLNGCLNY